MPFGIGGTGTGGGGGKSFSLGPEQNWFEGATVAAARTARDTYQHAPANRGWLERYEANRLLFVVLQPTTGAIVAEVVDNVSRTSASVFGKGSIPARPTSGAPSGRGANRRWQFDIGTGAQSTAFKAAFDGRGSGAEWYLRVNGQGADRRVTSIARFSSGAVRVFYEGESLTLASTTWDIIQTTTTPTWQQVDGLGVKGTPGAKGNPGDSVSIQFSADGSTNWASTPPSGTQYLRTRIGTGAWNSAIKFVGDPGAAGSSIEVQYSSDGSSWHSTLASDDVYIRTRIGSSGSWSIGIRFVGAAGAAGASAQIQYSADGSNWHDTFATGDQYIRFRVGTGAWSAGARFIGATSDARSVYLQYSADNSNWHTTLVTTDRYIRFRLGTAGAWSTGVQFVGGKGDKGDPGDDVELSYSADNASWHSTLATTDRYIRFRVGSGSWSTGVQFVGQGAKGDPGAAGASVSINYSADNSNWHATLAPATDQYIRFRIGTGSWTAGVRFVGQRGPRGLQGNPAPAVQAQYSTDGNTWSSTYATGNIFIRWSYDGGTTYTNGIRFTGPEGPRGPAGSASPPLGQKIATATFSLGRGSLGDARNGGTRSASVGSLTDWTIESAVSSWYNTGNTSNGGSAKQLELYGYKRIADLQGYIVRLTPQSSAGNSDVYFIHIPIGNSGRYSYLADGLNNRGVVVGSVSMEANLPPSVRSGQTRPDEPVLVVDSELMVSGSYGHYDSGTNAFRDAARGMTVDVYEWLSGQAAPAVQAQYSSDGNAWTSSTTSTTRYIRFSYDGGTTWSGAIDLRGTAPAPQQETIYYGALAGTATTEATIRPLASTLSTESATVTGHDITLGPTSASGQRFVIIVPADHDIATLVNKAISVSALDEFTRIAWASPLSGVDVVSYHSGALRDGVTIEYTLTLTA